MTGDFLIAQLDLIVVLGLDQRAFRLLESQQIVGPVDPDNHLALANDLAGFEERIEFDRLARHAGLERNLFDRHNRAGRPDTDHPVLARDLARLDRDLPLIGRFAFLTRRRFDHILEQFDGSIYHHARKRNTYNP